MRLVPPLLAAALLAAMTPAAAEVLDAAPGGFALRNTADVPVAPDAAWRVLVGEVDAWWPRDHTWWGAASTLSIEPRAGGCFCERAPDGEVEHLRVVFVQPGVLLRMTGGLGPLQGLGLHGALDWRLEALPARPGDDGTPVAWTRIRLEYRVGGYAGQDLGAFAPVVDRVQAQQLGGLASRLGGAVPPAPAEATAE